MVFNDLDAFLDRAARERRDAPLALVFLEDGRAAGATVQHLRRLGFARIAVLGAPHHALDPAHATHVDRIRYDATVPGAVAAAVDAVTAATPGRWIHYCFNAEFLFFPFCESRSIRDLVTFVETERRTSVLTFVVDLYAGDLAAHPDGVAPEDAHMDRAGYFALPRRTAAGHPRERQLDFYGGLKFRFEEHVPPARRRIDRVGLFRAAHGLRLGDDHRFNIQEYNTYACPWHNNVTAAICSFRSAKALRANPGSRFEIGRFTWDQSIRFEWRAQQLMDLGLMEPGQWF